MTLNFIKKIIEHFLFESAAGPLIRVWEEILLLFIDYLRKIPSIPIKKLNDIFEINKYQ